MNINITYEDSDVLVVDKPAGVVVFPEGATFAKASAGQANPEKTLIDDLISEYPDLKNVGEAPRYGIVHRLDKNTSGLILVAKTEKALIFLQKQFKNREVDKKYTALAVGALKDDHGVIHTLIGRAKSDPRKQATHSLGYTGKKDLREAITEYQVLQRFADYTLLEVQIKTGRKHQIRTHLAYIHHPIAGDDMYGFKDSPKPEGLSHQFLHASYLKITLPSGQMKEFHSDLPEDLKNILKKLEK